MKHGLLNQIKNRRVQLKVKQSDMLQRTGLSRQQYQFLEKHGNPTLQTLEVIALGLNSEIMLIPKDKIHLVQAILKEDIPTQEEDRLALQEMINNPWKDLFGDC
jgi:transcriptional regulator with XRE-family HTH domain